jgi:hypothetical protein
MTSAWDSAAFSRKIILQVKGTGCRQPRRPECPPRAGWRASGFGQGRAWPRPARAPYCAIERAEIRPRDKRRVATDRLFTGNIPEVYERLLVPLLFESYARDLAERVAKAKPQRILETAAGTGALPLTTRNSSRVLRRNCRERCLGRRRHIAALQRSPVFLRSPVRPSSVKRESDIRPLAD